MMLLDTWMWLFTLKSTGAPTLPNNRGATLKEVLIRCYSILFRHSMLVN